MSWRFYLIDGYNLLYAAGLARPEMEAGKLERARGLLLTMLAEHLDADSRRRMEIIFDARFPPPGLAAKWRFHGIHVQFSVQTGEADALIERRIRRHSAPKQLWVVSSDQRLIDAAKRRGAVSVTSDRFLERLFADRITPYRGNRPRGETSEPATIEPGGTTAEWLDFFGWDALSTITVEPDRPLPEPPTVPNPAKNREEPPSPTKKRPPDAKQSRDAKNQLPEAPPSDVDFWQRRIDELFDNPDN